MYREFYRAFILPSLIIPLVIAFLLWGHFSTRRTAGLPPARMRGFLAILASLLILTPFHFIKVWSARQPITLTVMTGVVVWYGVMLFISLSEVMLMGFAKYLTAKRGEKWTKELDYVYLAIGSVGILASINRLEFVTGRFEMADILAPLLLTTAVAIRIIKTRAEIGGWNKPTDGNN